jgi:hypothetical protein
VLSLLCAATRKALKLLEKLIMTNTALEITMPVWKTPDSYFGYDPVGDFVLYSRHRDSDLLTESNWECLQRELETLIKTLPTPETRYKKTYYGEDEELPSDWMYHWEAAHWAVGWVQYLMIRADAPEELLEKADELYHHLKNEYPILDEMDYSEKQEDAMYQYWKDSSIKERMEFCEQAHESIFAARRDDTIPEGVYDSFRDSQLFD